MSNWVRFEGGLLSGQKRGLPRAVRFVFLELALKARPFGGRLPLPPMRDVDAIHDIIGGHRGEIARLLELCTVPLDPSDPEDEPMISLDGPERRRVLVIPSWDRVNGSPISTPRVKLHREQSRALEWSLKHKDEVACVSLKHARGEERRGEEKRGEGEAPAVPAAPLAPAPLEVQEPTKAVRPTKVPKGTRLPETWEPAPELVDRLRRELRVDPLPAVRRFRNYWTNANRNALKPRWDLAFENWVEKDRDEGKLQRLDDADVLPILRLQNREALIPSFETAPDFSGFSFGATK